MIQLSYLTTEEAMKADTVSKNGSYLKNLMSRVKNKKKKVILIFISFIFILSANGQIETVRNSDCSSNLENVFKVLSLKVKWEGVQFFNEENGGNYVSRFDKKDWCPYFDLFRDLPPDLSEHKDSLLRAYSESIEKGNRLSEAMFQYAKEHNCAPYEALEAIQESSGVKTATVKCMSKEEVKSYIDHLFTPEEVYKEYRDLIQHIKSEKEIYLKCIDTALAKGDLSGYARPYSFTDPMSSLLPPLVSLTKLDYLKIFKEFIFNNNEDVLPDEMRADAYLKVIEISSTY
ncbi:MAG: hypothetical protein FWD66_11430 [Paludibacter sp.]|nr:hypothetical protein [Paludibacter sp.]